MNTKPKLTLFDKLFIIFISIPIWIGGFIIAYILRPIYYLIKLLYHEKM
jgi:hypothetical protein